MIDFSKFNADSLTKAIEKHVKDVTEQIAVRTYNYILDNEFPYFSGAYISSWRISAGSIDYSFNPAPAFQPAERDVGIRESISRGIHEVPTNINSVIGLKPFESVYITNSVPHAYKVENEGTNTSKFLPWKIAAHSVNNALVGYNYN